MENNKFSLIQSYVSRRWFVSTTYRQSSVMADGHVWYFETIVWEGDNETKKKEKMIKTEDSGSSQEQAMLSHINICGELLDI